MGAAGEIAEDPAAGLQRSDAAVGGEDVVVPPSKLCLMRAIGTESLALELALELDWYMGAWAISLLTQSLGETCSRGRPWATRLAWFPVVGGPEAVVASRRAAPCPQHGAF